jgi:hypothetical protein
VESEDEITELAADIQVLIEKGLGDDQIVQRMEFEQPSDGRRLIGYFRERLGIPSLLPPAPVRKSRGTSHGSSPTSEK